MRRKLVLIGGSMAVFGLVTGFSSIFVPWLTGGVTVLNIPKGLWYVLLLLALVALLGAAAMGTDQGRKLAGVSGPVLSLVTEMIVVGLITTSAGRSAAGSWLALVAMPLLGFSCGLIAIGRARRHVSGFAGVAGGHD